MRKNIDELVKLAQSILSIPHLDAKHKRRVSKVIAAMNPAAKKLDGSEIVKAQAKALYCAPNVGNIEVDDDPVILEAEDGCFVMGWLYVPNTSKE